MSAMSVQSHYAAGKVLTSGGGTPAEVPPAPDLRAWLVMSWQHTSPFWRQPQALATEQHALLTKPHTRWLRRPSVPKRAARCCSVSAACL